MRMSTLTANPATRSKESSEPNDDNDLGQSTIYASGYVSDIDLSIRLTYKNSLLTKLCPMDIIKAYE